MATQETHPILQPVPPRDPGDGPPGRPIVTGPAGSQDPLGPAGSQDPLDPYSEGVPDFRNDQSGMGPPDPNHYDPNEDVEQYGYQTGINGEKNYDINVGMTGGLMDTVANLERSPYGRRNYNVRAGNAVNRTVQDEERSQYQLEQMLASNSPLMQQAAAQGLARGGSRGLMNSSLSTGAAQGAMIAGAQPFATQDASWYGETAADNMDATNSMGEANLRARTASMEAGARRDITMLNEVATGYGDIRKAMIDIESREDEQRWKTGESEAGRNWQTGERLGAEDYKAAQDELNRLWTTDENMKTNSLAWAQSVLDSTTKMGISRGQAIADAATAIWSNPDKKFSREERLDAISMVQEEIGKFYPDSDMSEYERSYDPATGQFDESLREQNASPPVSSEQRGELTIVTHEDGTRSIKAPQGFDWAGFFNKLQ